MTNHYSLIYCSLRSAARLFSISIISVFFITQFNFSSAQTQFQNITPTCGSSTTFTDPGGAGNYSANQHYVYTICPSAGNYATVNFTNIALGNNDNITIINGDSSQDPYITTITGSQTNLSYTSSNPNGCLTVIFSSDGTQHGAGWSGSYTCGNVSGTNPSLYCQETDCVGGCARTVCGSGIYTWQNAGANMADLNTTNAGCLTAHSPNLEVNHVWYYINPQSPGILEVLIESGAGGQIYDFALWQSTGETVTCPSFSGEDPFMCESENNGQNNTTPQGSGFADDVWVDPDNPTNLPYSAYPGYEPPVIVTQADIDNGVVFMLLINVRSNGTPQPVVNINMDGELDCTPLPVRLIDLYGLRNATINEIHWSTQSEQNNSHFIVERSMNSFEWEVLAYVAGQGTSTEITNYRIDDTTPYYPLTYYRLKQVDTDGEVSQLKTFSLSSSVESKDWISSVFPNPATQYMVAMHNYPDIENTLFIEISDNLGKLIYLENRTLLSKNEGVTIDLNGLSSGLYTVQFKQGDRIKTERLIINK